MKKFFALVFAFLSSVATAGPGDLEIAQYDQFGIGRILRLMPIPPGSASGVLIYDGLTTWPRIAVVDSSLTISAGVMGVSTATLAGKFDAPTGSAAQYIRGDGSLATFPSVPAGFDFGFPATRTLAVATSYQATNPAKAAVITPSFSCTNATTVLAASACTLQVRVHTSAVTCSTGTVYYTVSQTVNLGVLLTQAQTVPQNINLPAGAFFVICPTAGTFTIAAVEQSAG